MKNEKKILMHACCGPCTLEPYRLLQEEGWDITIYFANDNIFPESEFDRRHTTLKKWAAENNVDLVVDLYDNEAWQKSAGKLEEAAPNTPKRKNRCRHCYRQRFEKTAKYAAAHNFTIIGTTLSVSPYQYTKIIYEELQRAAKKYDIDSYFVDFTPQYHAATIASRKLGMYRQNYCGCEFSDRESREQRKKRATQKAANLEKQKAAQKEARERSKRRREYNERQRRKKQLLKEYKKSHNQDMR